MSGAGYLSAADVVAGEWGCMYREDVGSADPGLHVLPVRIGMGERLQSVPVLARRRRSSGPKVIDTRNRVALSCHDTRELR